MECCLFWKIVYNGLLTSKAKNISGMVDLLCTALTITYNIYKTENLINNETTLSLLLNLTNIYEC